MTATSDRLRVSAEIESPGASSSLDLCEALKRPETYPHRPPTVEFRETHISCVFLTGDLVYKLKKPVVFDFVDYGTPERRREMCEQEIVLNSRMAPGIYRCVRGVVIVDGDHAELTSADDPRAVDFVVEMNRYDERRTLASVLGRGDLTADDVTTVGRALALWHGTEPPMPVAGSAALACERRFEQNLHELYAYVREPAETARLFAFGRFAHAFVAAHRQLLDARAAAGLTRDGHGDLRAEHVVLDNGVAIVDCVEFDRNLRDLDVADDLAFLFCDMVAHGGGRLSTCLVDAYRSAGGDPGPDSLIAFYAVYRALVRAKVDLIRAAQLPAESRERRDASDSALDLLSLAERFAWRAREPLVLVICGVPASGKSHLANRLAELSGLPHLNSDVTRKRLLGLPAHEHAPADAYSADWNARVYENLAREAHHACQTCGGAIVDATFRQLTDRRAFRSAFRGGPLVFVECRAPAGVVLDRALRRSGNPDNVSDADQGIAARESANWAALDEVPARSHIAVRTDRPLAEIVDEVIAALDRRLMEFAVHLGT